MLKIQTTNKFVPRPRFLIYGKGGAGKTNLCATCETPGENDILYGFTESGIQTVSHLALPYVDIKRCDDYVQLVNMLKAGKPDGQGGILMGNKLFRGVIVDLWGELVQMNLMDMVREAKVKNKDRDQDDPSEYEYKKLNFRMIRLLRDLRDLPLKYVGFTAYVEDRIDKTSGALVESKPEFVGTKIWKSMVGQVDYVFRIDAPVNVKDSMKFRNIRTQPSQVIYAKSRIPGIDVKLPLPAEVKYNLGDRTLLNRIFNKVDKFITEVRQLEPSSQYPGEEIVIPEPTEADGSTAPTA
jgi:hypothetical protein